MLPLKSTTQDAFPEWCCGVEDEKNGWNTSNTQTALDANMTNSMMLHFWVIIQNTLAQIIIVARSVLNLESVQQCDGYK